MPGAGSAEENPERADLLAALTAQDLEVVDQVELQPALPSPVPSRAAAAPPDSGRATLAVDLSPNEQAVVLLEQDGLYSWHFPTHTAAASAPPSRSRASRGLTPATTASFTIEFHQAPPAAPQRRGLVQDFIMA